MPALQTHQRDSVSIVEILERPKKLGRRRRRRRWFFGLLAAGVLAAVFLVGAGGPPAALYESEKVKRGDLSVSVATSGTLTPQVNAKVVSAASGRVATVEADFGMTVTAGQVLARLEGAVSDA